MSFEVTGKLVSVLETMQRTATFKVREFVIEKTDDIGGRAITNYIKFQCVQDKTDMPGKFNLGDEVKVSFNLKGNKSEKDGRVNYFTNLDAWRMEYANMQQTAVNQTATAKSNMPPDYIPTDVPDDLPF